MDCNKEEATRAKDVAEKKMQSRDFAAAKKLLLKASKLFPDIENASHMLTVCDVHCAAGSLVNGQTDHYGVLQVEVSADEALIKKQYRRLALLLHPDKNKFAGAEAAFKLIGEAYKVLYDKANRQIYDSKRRVQVRTGSSWQPSQNARSVRRYTATTINVSTNQFGGLKTQEQQPPFTFFTSQCFWTMCVFCNNRFQYSRSWLNREVQCQNCFKKFHAFEVSPQNVPPPGSSSGFNWRNTGSHETAVPAQHSYNHASQTPASQPSKPVDVTMHGYGSRKEEKVESCGDGMAGNQKSDNTKPENKPSVKPSSGNARRMRNRRVVNSSDSDSAESDSTDSDGISEVDPTVLDGGPTNSRYPRRSTRSKVNVTYKEDESEDDDDFVRPLKKLRKVGSVSSKNQCNSSPEVVTNGVKMKNSETPISEDGIKGEQTGDVPCKENSPRVSARERGMMPESEDAVGKKDKKQARASSNDKSAVGSGSSFSYPDPEFYDFDNDRDQSRFAVNQIWAVYDDDDGMPRYYALIQKVLSPGFRLQYSWLENNPTSTAEKAWVKAELPIACGNFTPGNVCSTKSQQMFSHLVSWEKNSGGIYNIYPKKGEVWALFKDWDIGWSSAAERPKKYVYEIAEVISDFAYGKDITVSHLVKVEGFQYLFAPDRGTTVIPSGQLLKFSHCIPYYKVSTEREGSRDCFELDPAALPESHVKITDADIADTAEVPNAKFVDPETEDKLAGKNKRSEFYNFQEMRSEEKFEQGQIWALYSEVVEYPNYYAWVKKVEWEESGLISIKWLELSPETQEEKLWSKNGLPFGCGRFKVVSGVSQFDTTDAFSHMVHAKPVKKNDFYEIYPNSGEIWAVFKNWSLRWTSKDIGKVADFIVVEIIERNECVIKAVALTKVEGYNNVFMPESRGVADIEISIEECLRFSHQIPAFRLTNQDFGKLKGYWELDSDSIPTILSTMDS